MKKQTAVNWLWDISQHRELDKFDFEQALAMEREQMLELISFVRVHNKMGKTAEDLLEHIRKALRITSGGLQKCENTNKKFLI